MELITGGLGDLVEEKFLGDDYCMGLSENSVALNPMVNDHYPY